MTTKKRHRVQAPKPDLWSLDGLPERKDIVTGTHVRRLRTQIARAESALRKTLGLRGFGSLNYVRHMLWLLGDERSDFYANEILRQDFEDYIVDMLSGWCRGRNAFLGIAHLAANRERSKYMETRAACDLAIGDEYAKLGRAKEAARYFRLVATGRKVSSFYRTLARTRLEALRILGGSSPTSSVGSAGI